MRARHPRSCEPGRRARLGACRAAGVVAATILGWGLTAPAQAMTINVVDGTGVTAQLQTAMTEVVNAYDAAFANPITLTVGLVGGPCPSCLGDSNSQVGTTNYSGPSSFYSAMTAYSSSGLDNPTFNTAYASLPASSTLGSTNSVTLTAANLTALGYTVNLGSPQNFTTANGFDGVITINTGLGIAIPSGGTLPSGDYDLIAVLEHELDEVMGIGSALDFSTNPITPYAEDYYRYSAPGTRSWSTSASTAYFSINGGTTDLATFNQHSGLDYNDWANGCPAANPLPQDASACPNQVEYLMQNATTPDPEMTVLDALGYDLANTAPLLALDASQQTVPEPASLVLLAPALLGLLRLRRRMAAPTLAA